MMALIALSTPPPPPPHFFHVHNDATIVGFPVQLQQCADPWGVVMPCDHHQKHYFFPQPLMDIFRVLSCFTWYNRHVTIVTNGQELPNSIILSVSSWEGHFTFPWNLTFLVIFWGEMLILDSFLANVHHQSNKYDDLVILAILAILGVDWKLNPATN